MAASGSSSSAAYGPGDRFLHRLALGSRAVLETSFDLERARFGDRAREIELDAPIFICGLARAGTTILTRLLHGTGLFASPTYRDLPFALAPISWSGLSRSSRREVKARERGHGDGLAHDLDSPEAIEEVFWRCFEGKRYLRADGLAPVAPEPETLALFRDYVALICLRYGSGRYLSKNNNNILRLPAIVATFPDALVLHPVRHPADQAHSLLLQHRQACALHARDRFRLTFMRWLGHHEFGADQRPFLLPGTPRPASGPDTLDYWLAQWIGAHAHLAAQPPTVGARQMFIPFETLVDNPTAAGARLAEAVGVDPHRLDLRMLHEPGERELPSCDAALLRQALDIYEDLCRRSSAPVR